MQPIIVFIFSISFILWTTTAHAAAMIMRIQQLKAQRNHQAQQEYSQEYQQYNQEVQNPNQPAPPPDYQQLIDQRNQALAQAIINAHNLAVNTNNLPVTTVTETNSSASPSSGDTVDLVEVWKKLDVRSTIWSILPDDQSKMLTVSEYINRFAQEGVKISLPPTHYVQMIDQMSQQNPHMLDMPFGELLQIIAIIDYDFDNGMDKDFLAKKVLGEQAYEANKQRFSSGQHQ